MTYRGKRQKIGFPNGQPTEPLASFFLEVETPDPNLAQSFSDCFRFTLTYEGGSCIRFFYEVDPAMMWFTLLLYFRTSI